MYVCVYVCMYVYVHIVDSKSIMLILAITNNVIGIIYEILKWGAFIIVPSHIYDWSDVIFNIEIIVGELLMRLR